MRPALAPNIYHLHAWVKTEEYPYIDDGIAALTIHSTGKGDIIYETKIQSENDDNARANSQSTRKLSAMKIYFLDEIRIQISRDSRQRVYILNWWTRGCFYDLRFRRENIILHLFMEEEDIVQDFDRVEQKKII